jgi:subtilisin family serine protease
VKSLFLGRGALMATIAIAVGLSAGVAGGATGGTAAAKSVYIVQMLQSPAAAYTGGIAGYERTKPAKGQKLNPDAQAVVKYTGYLKARHDAVLSRVGGGEKLYDYAFSYNGFAAKLTEGQAAALEKQADVVAVSPNQLVESDTSSTPTFLGLDAPGGLWSQLGGPAADKKGVGAGENIIIGIVDSGIWPESKSFSDRDHASGKLVYQPLSIDKWHGKKCELGEGWDEFDCNKKLIGARFFNESWGGSAALEAERPWEFMSPRDYNGHGSHTASTAGGNYNTPTTGPAAAFGPVSGMAPRARIAAYKALWSTQDAATASGFTGDLVAAIDTAVADGVDVINYSISGSQTDFANPVMLSFLFAADAGVFVSTSAGNSGPTTSTVAHPGPWVTTVAAGTHNRNGRGSVTLGNGTTYNGASVASPVGPAPLIDSVNAGLAGKNPTEVELCFIGTLDPAKVTGKIVLCKRGVNARVDKSRAVQEAGGVGMVLYNDPDGSLNADFHFVPTVHVDRASGLAIKAYAATAGATARINQSTLTFSDPAPFTASFSSRGPLRAGGGDLLKPDVIAPGQDILAAVAPPGNAGRDFNLYSGTSMSAPHVAGLGALLKHRHPSWSPMAIKSALMTSGGDVLDGPNTNPLVIFRQGAGHVRPNNAANPGLVFDSGFNDWVAMLCGSTNAVSPAFCDSLKAQGYSFDVSDMNVASVAIGDMAGVQTVKRRVTNVGGTAATYTPSVSGLTGITVSFNPAVLTIGAGETKTLEISFRRTTATLGSYAGGQITFSDGAGGHTVRIPAVIRPVAIATPAEVSSNGAPVSWSVTTGYDGALSASVAGLVPATQTAWTVAQDPDQTFNPADPTGTFKKDVVVPANSLFRAGIYEDAITPTGTDLDLYVYQGATQVGVSADGDSNEEVTLRTGATGTTLTVYVHGWSTNGPSATGTLFDWVATTAAGNTTVSGVGPATTGGTQTHTASFSGLAAGTRYLGEVRYSDGSATIGRTILNVRTP